MGKTIPPFCNAMFGSNTSGSSSTGAGTSSGGPPSNSTGVQGSSGGGGSSTGGMDISNIPLMGLVDICFEPKASVEFTILCVVILYYIPSLIYYFKYRNHILIKYRQPKVVMLASILSTIMSILVPLFRYFEVICLVNTWTINLMVFATSILTYSRYVRVYFMQRLSIFKLKFGEKKNSAYKKEREKDKTDWRKSYTVKGKESFLALPPGDTDTIKTSSISKSICSTEASVTLFGIADPVLYFKKLNIIINKKITLYLVVCPLIFFIAYSIYITASDWDTMTSSCVNEHRAVGTPKTILVSFILTSSIFLFYESFYKQKWDIEIKIEFVIFTVYLAISTLTMQLTVKGHLPNSFVRYRMYIYYVFSAIVHGMCVIIPLLKILFKNIKPEEGKLSEEEFLAKLSNSVFKAQVKEIATNTFCIENVLFFDAHCDLMNIVINYYSKKNNIPSSEANSYTSSDILRTNTISPILYKPFDNIFKRQYDQVYNLYIKEDGIAAINIKSSTIKNIEELMENDNYNYLMFNEAAEEIGELLYSNIYPRMKG
ncbi:hypothetical protein BCR32DRAFT_292684 [Anaeromyces robustus]|uniref:RGS domain-containing protein n=1 Tax=Anaeromyces robustus TaxID=1754192 RepID=A0A1Y1X9E5_9FUNG|nr:hypothetical protein BCR32DRAFT_292684 [Anaeromyces robustus]|eukprot:ORX82373.1 hypothetical protein BCR32DRAFT_292684 [Anaeromyces robustus]